MKELSTKGFVSSLMILYLLSILAIVGVITDKIVKTSSSLINLKNNNDNVFFERAAILTLKEYLNELKEYEEKCAEYQNELNSSENEKNIEIYEEQSDFFESPTLDTIYVNGESIRYIFLDNEVKIYFKNIILNVNIEEYKVMSFSYD